jgi:ATP phosphoribosyltransferase regulatory subunit HisZ
MIDAIMPQAGNTYHLAYDFINHNQSLGYQYIMPSLLAINDGGDDAMPVYINNRQYFLRSDITNSIISEIAEKTQADKQKPIRLCYSSGVINQDSTSYNTNRQSLQTGVELISDVNIASYLEVLQILINYVTKHDADELKIYFSLPKPQLLVAKPHREDFLEALFHKSLQKWQHVPNHKIWQQLCLDITPSLSQGCEILSRLDNLPQQFLDHINILQQINDKLSKTKATLKFDLSDCLRCKTYDYHNGIYFSARTKNGFFSRGGGYNIGVGFSFYANNWNINKPA